MAPRSIVLGRPVAHWSLREVGVFENRHEKDPGTADVSTTVAEADEAADVVGAEVDVVDAAVDKMRKSPEPRIDVPGAEVVGTVVALGAGLVGVNLRGR